MSDQNEFGDIPGEDDGLDLHPKGAVTEESVLAALQKELSEPQADDIHWYPIPERSAITLGFNCSIDFDMLQSWIRRATIKRTNESGVKGNLNSLAMAKMVLSMQSVGAMVNGNDITKDGEAVTLGHPYWQELLGTTNTATTMKALFKKDGYMLAMMQQVLEDAGYGDVDLGEGDPLSED